jgi:hypothetical protein
MADHHRPIGKSEFGVRVVSSGLAVTSIGVIEFSPLNLERRPFR